MSIALAAALLAIAVAVMAVSFLAGQAAAVEELRERGREMEREQRKRMVAAGKMGGSDVAAWTLAVEQSGHGRLAYTSTVQDTGMPTAEVPA